MKLSLLTSFVFFAVVCYSQRKFVETIDLNQIQYYNSFYNDSVFDTRKLLRNRDLMNDTLNPDQFSTDLIEMILFSQFVKKKRQKRKTPIEYSKMLSGLCNSYIDYFGEHKIKFRKRTHRKFNKALNQIFLHTKYQYGIYQVFCFRAKMIKEISFFYDPSIGTSPFNLYRGKKKNFKNDPKSATPALPHTNLSLVNQLFSYRFYQLFDEWVRIQNIKEIGCSVSIDPKTLGSNKNPEVVMVFITSTSRIIDPEKVEKNAKRARSWKRMY